MIYLIKRMLKRMASLKNVDKNNFSDYKYFTMQLRSHIPNTFLLLYLYLNTKSVREKRRGEEEREYIFSFATVNGDPPRSGIFRVHGSSDGRRDDGKRTEDLEYGNVCMSCASRCLIII